MKKPCIFLALILSLTVLCLPASAAALGDVDGNSKIEAADARLALRAAVGLEDYAAGSEAFKAADADKNGKIEAADARVILRAAVGLEQLPDEDQPASVQEIADFYKAAVRRVKDGEAGYTKAEWQTVDQLKLSNLSAVNNSIQKIVDGLLTTEEKARADASVNETGTEEAMRRFPAFTLTDYSWIASANCTDEGGNYRIKIVMADEDTPQNAQSSFLAQVTNSVLYWDDIEKELSNYKISKVEDAHVLYRATEIDALITPDGRFISLTHTLHAEITIGSARLLLTNLKNLGGTLENVADFSAFSYASSVPMLQGVLEIADFYKAAVNKVKNDGAAGYTKKEWQAMSDVHLMGGAVDNLILNTVDSLITTEGNAENQEYRKGSETAKNRFVPFTLTDYSKIASASCISVGNNYKIKIVMADEDTPKNRESSFLGQVSNSVLYWDTDIQPQLSVYKISDVQDAHVLYSATEI